MHHPGDEIVGQGAATAAKYAWDTQKIKEMHDTWRMAPSIGRKAVMGALTLYLDLTNLFLFILHFFGDRHRGGRIGDRFAPWLISEAFLFHDG